jgi:hypothetical protein
MIDQHGDAVVGADAHKGVGCEGRGPLRRRLLLCRRLRPFRAICQLRQVNAKHQAAARQGARLEKAAPAEIEDFAHRPPPCAFI